MKKRKVDTRVECLLLLVIFCAVIPHTVLWLIRLNAASIAFSPAGLERCANFFACQWIPFWMTFLCYLRLQKADGFSWMPCICAAVIVLTYLPGFENNSVMTIALAIPLTLAVELSGFLSKAEFSKNKAVAAIAADRGILRAFYYWSVVFLCAVHISCMACTYERTVVSPFQMLPVPGVLLFEVFRHQKKQPPGLWSVIGMLGAIPLSLFLAAVGPMEQFRIYHLLSLGVGYVLLFLMLLVYNIDQWKK